MTGALDTCEGRRDICMVRTRSSPFCKPSTFCSMERGQIIMTIGTRAPFLSPSSICPPAATHIVRRRALTLPRLSCQQCRLPASPAFPQKLPPYSWQYRRWQSVRYSTSSMSPVAPPVRALKTTFHRARRTPKIRCSYNRPCHRSRILRRVEERKTPHGRLLFNVRQ